MPLIIPRPAGKVVATTLQLICLLFVCLLFLLRFALRICLCAFTQRFPFSFCLACRVRVGVQLLLARKGTVALPARELDASFCNSFVKGNDVIEQVSMPANGAVDDHRAGQHCLVRQRCLVFSKELV